MAGAIVGAGTALFGASQKKKAQKKAESFAASEAEKARAEQRRLEEKFSLTPGELERQDRVFELEKRRQSELEGRASKSGEELLRDAGPITGQLLDEIQERQGLTGQELFEREGDVNRLLVDDISNFDEQAFKPELDLVLQAIDQEANRRGVFGGTAEGGIRFENLGRAGVDLAVRKATERLNQRQQLSSAFTNLAAGARGEAGRVGESALSQEAASRDELANFLAQIQGLNQQSKGRAAQVATSAFGTAQPIVSQFGTVPIQFQGQKFGEGQALQREGLGLIGETLSDLDLFRGGKVDEPEETTIGDITSGEDRPITRNLLERTGSNF